jgi:two-component system sensor histidine kinase AtoS
MNFTAITGITLLSFVFVVGLLYILRTILNNQKRKIDLKSKDVTQVGFVVDTFHDLVSKLKEKERELDILRKNAEERASAVEIYNEDILQSVPSGVISFDQALRITKMNAAAEKILDISGDEVIGKKYTDIFSKAIVEIIERDRAPERAEVAYSTRSGKRIWLGLNISPLKDSSGNRIGQILVFSDLTELKAFQSQMELRERLSTLGEMSAGIAHELRNPMAVILGYTKILRKKVDEGLVPAVEAISKEVSVMDRIITDFLSFAKPAEPMFSEVDLNELVDGCIKGVSDRAEGIHIVSLPVIKADEITLRQAVSNLLQNAVESMPDGGELRIAGTVDDHLNIMISDTGHGIPESIKEKIFLPFFTTKEKGTGLGLSIVHKIVGSHGGTIEVDTGDKGTTFTINLPLDIVVGKGRQNAD